MTVDGTIVVAVWGAATGTLALVVSYLNYRRDRAVLKVSCAQGVVFTERLQHGPLVMIQAVNVGRRPIRLESAGFIADRAPRERLTTFGDLQTFPKVLNESETVTVQVDPKSAFEQSIGAGKGRPTIAFFLDSAGRLHKARVPASVMRLVEGGAPATWKTMGTSSHIDPPK